MSSHTLYTDDVLSIHVDSETNISVYKFFINKHLKMGNDAIVSTILKYMEWEFKYMSKESLLETIKGVFEVVYGNIPFGKLKLLKVLNKKGREELDIMVWDLILSGEGYIIHKHQ